MSQEDSSEDQEYQQIFSWLESANFDIIPEEEVNTEDSYEWDNYRETLSFVDPDPEEDHNEQESSLTNSVQTG